MVSHRRDRVEARYEKFVDAYLTNGHNAAQAVITAGYSPKSAAQKGNLLMKVPGVKAMVDARMAELNAITGLDAVRTLREVARICYSDPRQFYNADGTLKAVIDMDDDTRAAIASVEVDETSADEKTVGRTTKIKYWDKNAALEKAMRYLGLFEKDNKQRGENLNLQVVLIGPP